MYKYVNEMIAKKDNIIDQLKYLKKNKNRKGVQKYIRNFMSCLKDDEPEDVYRRNCINKYFYDLDVEDMEEPLPKCYCMYYNVDNFVIRLLKTQDNMAMQLKELSKYKDRKDVQQFIEDLLEYTLDKYELYCITKYYHGIDVEEVKPTPITLFPIADVPRHPKKLNDNKK